MAHLHFCSYIAGHETTREPATTGEAPPAGYPVAPTRQDSVGGGALAGRVQEFCGTMARGAQAQGLERASSQRYSWASSATIRCPESTLSKVSPPRTFGSRILDRPVDLTAHCQAHREALSCVISPQPRVATVAEHGLELSEAGAPRAAEGRTGDRTLETGSLARDKKKPQDVVPTWSFWMKAVSYSFPTSNAPGPPKGRRPISTTGSDKIGYRPLPPSAFLPNRDTPPSTSGFISAISREPI